MRDAIADATRLRAQTQQAMEKADIQPARSPGPGESVNSIDYSHPLQRIWARLVTAPGIYEQGMLIDQLGNIARAEGGADQKVGAESRRRLDDLLAEMKAIEAEVVKGRRGAVARTTSSNSQPPTPNSQWSGSNTGVKVA